jgi:tRNA nucleotidyltransferase (CCA-adding enzyme)
MKFTKIDASAQMILKELLSQTPVVIEIVAIITKNGGKAFLVGGAVRDILQGVATKDLDIEVHGLSLQQLQTILEQFGPVSLVGKSFGVLRLHGIDIDWSLPRTDSAGRKPEVVIDPNMNFADAFKRRDLTINAMGIDLHTFELVDPWGGYADLKAGVLRAPDEKLFIEDPLRFFRVMQFISRFEMHPDAQLNAICASMNIKDISKERIEAEFDKLFLRSKRPSLGIRWLAEIGRLKEILPELFATIGIKQEPDWHPEGDVFEHTMQAIDAAQELEYDNSHEKLVVLFAALCHDLGKVVTTSIIDGRIRSLEHEIKGVPLAKSMLARITNRHELIDTVAKLVRHHMDPGQYIKNGAKPPAYKRLALTLSPQTTIATLAKLAYADKRGRNKHGPQPLRTQIPEVDEFLKKAENLKVVYKSEEPIILGRDLFGIIEPGPRMGEIVKKAYEIQIEQGITDKQELLKKALAESMGQHE